MCRCGVQAVCSDWKWPPIYYYYIQTLLQKEKEASSLGSPEGMFGTEKKVGDGDNNSRIHSPSIDPPSCRGEEAWLREGKGREVQRKHVPKRVREVRLSVLRLWVETEPGHATGTIPPLITILQQEMNNSIVCVGVQREPMWSSKLGTAGRLKEGTCPLFPKVQPS